MKSDSRGREREREGSNLNSRMQAARAKEGQMTAKEMRNLINAMDEPEFRDLLSEYVDEISDPKGREEYEKYLT